MKTDSEISLTESHGYWLNYRIFFNLIVGLAGIIPVLLYLQHLRLSILCGITIWGVIANGLYSFGVVLEGLVITKTERARDFKRIRPILFWLGTLVFALLTFLCAFVFFSTRYELSD